MDTLRTALTITSVCFVAACSRAPTGSPGTPNKPGPAALEDIKVGQTMPYSGPASAYGTIGKLEAAYFKRLNEQGGINGHKIQFISLDDGYSPPKAVEQIRKLVEQEQVLVIFQALGTPSNSAIQKYLNAKKVPQLFVATGATKWGDPEHYPWTIGFNPTYQLEGRTYGRHILEHSPKAKIAVLYQNDDYGKDMLKGLKDGLGAHADMIVAEASYEVSDSTVDSQIATLKGSQADTFVDVTTPKFAAQAIRKVHDIGWKPTHYLNAISASVGAVLVPAGVDKAIGILTTAYFKDTNDKQWDSDEKMQRFRQFLATYYPEGNVADGSNTYAYIAAQVLEQTLRQCGSDLSRENIMKQAANLKNFAPDMLLPGITINTAPHDYFLFDQVQLARFDGTTWVAQGALIDVD
jgi:branched-chain amino acid transport system substrate-binding protein